MLYVRFKWYSVGWRSLCDVNTLGVSNFHQFFGIGRFCTCDNSGFTKLLLRFKQLAHQKPQHMYNRSQSHSPSILLHVRSQLYVGVKYTPETTMNNQMRPIHKYCLLTFFDPRCSAFQFEWKRQGCRARYVTCSRKIRMLRSYCMNHKQQIRSNRTLLLLSFVLVDLLAPRSCRTTMRSASFHS